MLLCCFRKFVSDENGATAIEYALIAGFVSIAIVGGLMGIKGALVSAFDSVSAGLGP